MKDCCICKIPKDESEFNKASRRKDGLQIHCRDCGKKRSKLYYKLNKGKHVRVTSEAARIREARNRERVQEYLRLHPCVDCGETDIVVLDFDHIRGTKFKNVSQMVAHGHSWDAILEEIKKCEVRCANDHRRVTFQRRVSQVLAAA